MRTFERTITTEKAFDEAVTALEMKAAEKGFRVLHTHDVAATLAEKGFPREPLKNRRDMQCQVRQPSAGERREDFADATLPDQCLCGKGKDTHQHSASQFHRGVLSPRRYRGLGV